MVVLSVVTAGKEGCWAASLACNFSEHAWPPNLKCTGCQSLMAALARDGLCSQEYLGTLAAWLRGFVLRTLAPSTRSARGNTPHF